MTERDIAHSEIPPSVCPPLSYRTSPPIATVEPSKSGENMTYRVFMNTVILISNATIPSLPKFDVLVVAFGEGGGGADD